MMKKYIISIVCALCAISGTAWAGPVDSQDAKQKAAAFLQKQAAHPGNARRAAALRAPQLSEAKAFGEALHVFNVGGDNGFVIVSGDDRTEEILGYVEGGSFDPNNMPDNMRFWLQMYADQIRSLGNSDIQRGPRREAKATIEPLVVTNWDQRNDYNDKLFFDSEEMLTEAGADADDVYTGCAATSMAQALYQAAQQYKKKHGQWPSNPTAQIPSYTISSSGKINNEKAMKALDPIVFDWEHMLPNYARKVATPTEQEIDAVATLMAYCGRAMHMEYGTTSSDAAFVYMPFRMAAYFGIQPYVKNMDRTYYTSQQWEDLLYNELQNGRAVPYTGVSGPSTSDPGHAFILDGYKDGLWHINWGWGMAEAINDAHYNGYFSLSVMQPDKSGTAAVSGGALDSEYKYLQQATIGVSFDPVEGGVANTCYTHIGGGRGYSSSTTCVTYLNYKVKGGDYSLDGAWAIANEDGSFTILKKDFENREFAMFGDMEVYNQYIDELPVDGIADGIYTVLHVSSLPGQNQWVADDGTELMNFTITVASGKITNVVCHPIDLDKANMKVTNIEFIGDMEANKDNIVRVTINNAGDDFWGNLAMCYNTETSPSTSKRYVQLAAVKPGETTHEFTVNLPKGEYKLWFFAYPADGYMNTSNYFDSGRKMFIGYGADANKVQVGNLKFDGQTGATLTVKSVNGQLEEVTGTFDVTNNAGHTFNNTYYINVESGSGYSKTVYATAEVPVSVEEGTTTVPFSLGVVQGLASGRTYKVRLYSKSGTDETDIATNDMTLQPYFRYWKADGTVVEHQEPTTTGQYSWQTGIKMDDECKSTAVAIDMRGVSNSYMVEVTNPNCLYYMTASQKPSSSYATFAKTNNVVDGVAETMTINGAYAFYAPEAFTAQEISYVRTFANGNNNDGKGWETIVLPFEVNSVKQGTKNISWFHSATDKRKHFWLMELTGADAESLTFDYATAFEANKPYIISVPGNKWGDNWNLAGKEITFRGVNVEVPVTKLEPVIFGGKEFTPTYATITTNGYILNAEGTFAKGEGTVNGYNAYFAAEGTVNALRIVIEGEEATGIEAVDNSQLTNGNEPIFNLNGQRLEQKQRGVNIVGGRKIVVK